MKTSINHAMPSHRWLGGSSPPVKRNHNSERCQSRRERCLQAIVITVPLFPLDLSCVSYDKCASSVQSRLGSVRAKDKLDQAHIQISASTDYGHSTQQINALQKFSRKNNALEPKLRFSHFLRDFHASGARISHEGHAR